MKKNTIKAFTLVEMLIVIVIIGILIAALMPRMQSAQGRARDVSRKTALSQIQSAIVTYQGDKGRWPGCSSDGTCTTGNAGMDVKDLENELRAAGMNSVPKDPLGGNKVTGLGSDGTNGEFRYMVTLRNGTPNGGFILMAKTEVEGGSNWVVCSGASDKNKGKLSSTDDIKDIHICETITRNETNNACNCAANTGACCYDNDAELRYIAIY